MQELEEKRENLKPTALDTLLVKVDLLEEIGSTGLSSLELSQEEMNIKRTVGMMPLLNKRR